MGGRLTVAIRRGNGTEYISGRWTNPLPHWLSNPGFWDDETVVDDYIKAGLEHNTPVDRVFPSEYGVVLIDFQTKRVFSRQDYCGVNNLTCAGSNLDKDDREHLLKLIELGWVTNYEVWRTAPHDADKAKRDAVFADNTLRPDELTEFQAWIREPKTRVFRTGMVIVHFQIPGWAVDDGTYYKDGKREARSDRAWDCWPEVVAFVEETGWKSPCWTQAEVDKEFTDDSEDDPAETGAS